MTRGHSVPLPCRILAGLLVVTLALPPHLLANPQGGQVRQGQVRIDASPGQLRIHQQSQRAVIDWESFSIDRGEVTRFLQPNASAAALNRVRGDSASRIEGMLRANGNVYLINPNGILIGPSGTIDVAGFVASTLDTSDDAFMRGGDLRFSGNTDAAIINLGSISALDGDVVLMAGSVLNAGTIRAPRGTAALAAGNDILLAESGEERVFVRGSGGSRKAEGVTNTGEIEANIAELKAHGGNIYGMAVKNEGRVAATGVTRSGGQIFLSAGGGKVRSTGTLKAKRSDGSGGRVKVDSGTTGKTEIGGTVDASGAHAGGGEIVILGNEIEVFDGTLILNDGENSGGRTYIGGGRHGADASLANAANLSIGSGSLISANARGTGDGGEIVLFATDTASVHGLVTAQGGAFGGDGGFIELSGQGRLYVPDLVGQVRLSAPLGASGSLLLDPANINVIHGTGGGIMGTTMTDGALMDVLANFPVLIWTSDYGGGGDGDITFAADVNLTWSSPHSLTFQADRDMIFLAGAQIFASGNGAFNATAARSISVGNGASIRTTNGDLNLSANAAGTTTGNFVGVDVNGGLVQSVGTGSVSVTGRGGNDAGGNQIGVRVRNGGDILGGTSGLVSVTGYGGASTGSGNIGVNVFSSATTTIGSAGANVEVTGTGGGGNASMGIELGTGNSNGRITAGGLGTVTVHGTGGTQLGGAFLHGILMGTSTIDSAGGNVSVTGIGGSGSNPSGDYTGIQMDDSTISAGGSGSVTVVGTAGTAATSQTLIGVDVRFTSQITSAGGNVSVTGTGGNTTNAVLGAGAGVRLIGNGTITAGGSGAVNVIGTGMGGSTLGHEGIVINGSGFNSNLARIGAANGTTALTATSGNGASHGLVVGTGTAGRIATGNNNLILIFADSISIGAAGIVSSGTGNTTINTRTAGTLINLGGADVLTGSPLTLGLTDAELDLITAGTLQIGNGDSGQITVSNAITHGNHLSLTTGAGVIINQAISMAANKNLVINALGTSTGTISLANANAALSASGTGAISLTTARNISLASGSSVTTVNGDLSLSANAAGTTTGAFIGIDLSGATLTTNGTGAITLTGKGGAGTAATDLKGVRLRLDAVVQSTLAGAGAGSITINGTGGGAGTSSSNGVQIGGVQSSGTNNTRISSVSGAILVTGAAGGGTGNNQSGIDIRDGGKIISTGTGANAATITLIGTAGTNSSNDYNVGVQLGTTNGNYVFGTAVTSVDGSISINGTGGSGNGFLNGIFIGDGAQVAASGLGGISLTGTGASGISTSNEGVRIFGQHSNSQASRVTAVNGTITIDGATSDADSHAVLVESPAFVSTTGSGNIVVIGDSMNLTGTLHAGSNTVTLRQKTNGTGIDLGSIGGVVAGTLRLSDAELDGITAGTLLIGNGSSGSIVISSALTHGNHLTLTTGSSVTFDAGLTLAANKNLLIEALDDFNGTISLATANADLGTSGTGSITIEAGRNLVLSPGSSITAVNGAISLTANRGPYPAYGSLIGMDLDGATVATTGTGAITLSGHGGDATGDQHGIRLRGGTSLATTGGNLTLLGEAFDPLSSGIRIDLASLTSGGGVLELHGTGGNTSIDSPDTNATIGAPGDTVIVKSVSGAVGISGQVRGYRLQLQDLGGADAIDFTLNNSNNDIDQFNTLGNGPNGRIGTLVFREANGFRVTDFLGGSGIAATGFLDLRATRFSGSSIVIDAPVTSQGGNITIVGRDVVVDGTEITTIGGGGLELNAGRAILVQGDSLLSVTDGELSVTAHQDEFYTTGTFTGLTILGSRVQSLGTGTIALYGKGGNGGTGSDFAYSGFTNPSTNGVRLDGGTVIASSHPSSNDFTVRIVGEGGLGASDSVGVVIANQDTVVSAASGTLLIEGFGGGQSTGQRNRGVLFTGGHVQATNHANITLYGGGGSGVNENDGIQLNSGARITAANGDMILDGYAGDTLGIGVMLGNTAGNLSITGTGSVTVQGEGTNADGIVLGNAGAFVGGTNAGFVELFSHGDLRVQRELIASGGIFLNASAGGTFVDAEIHSTHGDIAIEGDDVTIHAAVTADEGDIEIIFGDHPIIGDSLPDVESSTFNGTASINNLLTAGGAVRYYGGDGGGDLLTFAGYTLSGIDFDFGTLFDVEQVVGTGSSNDRLTGPAAASSYSFTGADAFQVGGVSFSAFENVLGGAADDTFAFSGSATLSGSLDGGGGTNTLDYTAYGTGVIIDLENGAATGIIGGFENIATFTGSGNIDTITGPGSASTYTFTGPDALQVGSVSVSGFENVIAGPLEDEFIFLPGSRIAGTLDGGSSPNPVVNRLNYAGYGAPVTVNLGAAPLAAATGIAGGFSNVNQFIGSALATDQFFGPATGTLFQITAPNTFSSAAFTASGFENLTGGIGSDTFAFAPGAALAGRLSGGTGPGIDTLDYSAFGRAVTVNIGPNTSTGIGGGFTDLERILGSAGNDRFNFLNQATISFVDGGGGTDLIEINDSTLRGENTYTITANSVSRNPLYTFNNFESLRLFLGTGNNTVNSDFFGYTQFIHGGAGYNTLNLPGVTSLNQGNPIRNVYHYGIDAPRPGGNDTGGLLQLEVNQRNAGPDTGQGFNTENRFSIVDPGTLSQQIGALSGAFAAAITAQASLIVVDGNPYLVFRPFSLDGSGITPSNLAIDALNESLGVDANLELAAAIGYTGPLFLFNPDGPIGLDLSGDPIDPAILTILQESITIAAAAELSDALGLNLVVSLLPGDGIAPTAMDGSAPGQSIVLLLSEQLGDPAQNELQAAIGTN